MCEKVWIGVCCKRSYIGILSYLDFLSVFWSLSLERIWFIFIAALCLQVVAQIVHLLVYLLRAVQDVLRARRYLVCTIDCRDGFGSHVFRLVEYLLHFLVLVLLFDQKQFLESLAWLRGA